MSDLKRGAKAGLAAGFIYMLVLIIFSAITAAIVITQYSSSVGSPNLVAPYIESMFGVTGFSAVILGAIIGILLYAIIVGVIGGIIFGIIYSAFYNSLPGSTSVIKGIGLSYIFWLIFSIVLNYSTIIYIHYFIVQNVIIGMLCAVIYGFFLGKFWDKFGELQRSKLVLPS